ncbi:MAG: hypothetical protein OHK0044_16540 [Burkholderiaceae bacterium]
MRGVSAIDRAVASAAQKKAALPSGPSAAIAAAALRHPAGGLETQWISSRFVGAGVRFGSVSVSTPFS